MPSPRKPKSVNAREDILIYSLIVSMESILSLWGKCRRSISFNDQSLSSQCAEVFTNLESLLPALNVEMERLRHEKASIVRPAKEKVRLELEEESLEATVDARIVKKRGRPKKPV